MKRRVHLIEHWHSAERFEEQLNKLLRNGERVVSTVVRSDTAIFVITEDLGLGPPQKK